MQDPGNLGTLVRSAVAFGWDGLVLLPGCCDPHNDKAVRASRGAVLRASLAALPGVGALTEAAKTHGLLLLCADMEDDEGEGVEEGREKGGADGAGAGCVDLVEVMREAGRKEGAGGGAGGALGGVCLVLGSEGRGLSPQVRAACTAVAVPMEPGAMESLNVGVAGSILMFALSRGAPLLMGKLAGRLRAGAGAA